MRLLHSLALIAAALAGCTPTAPVPAATAARIKTIGVIIDPWNEIEITQGGWDFNRRTYSASEWGVPDAFIKGIKQALEPRYEVIPIPALNVPPQQNFFYISVQWDLDNVVAPSIAASGVKADAYLFLDIQPNLEPVDRTSAPLRGCGVQSIAMMFQDGSQDAIYCAAFLRLLAPGTLDVLSSAPLASKGLDKAMATPLKGFTWQGVNLTHQQIAFLKKAFPDMIANDIPISLRALGLIE